MNTLRKRASLIFIPLLLFTLLLPVLSQKSKNRQPQHVCNKNIYPLPWKLRSDQTSILISGFAEARLPLLTKIARAFSVSPVVHSIYILWGNTSTPWSVLNQTDLVSLGAPVYIIRQPSTSLNDRFLPRTYIKTRSVMICDDDITIDLNDLKFAFQVWSQNQHKIVGFFPRSHEYQIQSKSWIYTIHPDREYVDLNMNCEDIAMNFVVANRTNEGPLLVDGKPRDWGDTRNSADELSSSALSAKKQHRKRRGGCITDFHRIWDSMPLRYSYGKVINSVDEQVLCEKHGTLVQCSDQM